MRRALIALACLGPALGACASSGREDSKMMTTSEANRSGIGGAVQAPLRDVNIIRTKIPDVLLEALTDPYARPAKGDCADLAELIRPLDETLGVPPRPRHGPRLRVGDKDLDGLAAEFLGAGEHLPEPARGRQVPANAVQPPVHGEDSSPGRR